MFTKKPENDGMNMPAPKPIGHQPSLPPAGAMSQAAMNKPMLKGSNKMVPSIIGADLTITGNVISKGEVQVDGSIQGDLHCASLIIGEKAEINGVVVAEDVVVRGHVTGSIHGVRVTLQASSHVNGDITHQSLAIEQGAFFEGKSRRSDDPIGTAPKLEIPNAAFEENRSSSLSAGNNSKVTSSSSNL